MSESITGSATYYIQYGRKLDFVGAGNQTTTLRVPAGTVNTFTLEALFSSLDTGGVTYKLDVGNNGTWDWQVTQDIADLATFTSSDLSAAFNVYWQNNGAPATGTLDVPIKISLSKAGQVLLTNLQVNSTGIKLRHVRMSAQDVTGFNLDFTIGGTGSGSQSVALDVGAEGTIDWSYVADGTLPRRLLSGDLKNTVNAYLSGKSGMVDVPMRFFVAPDQNITINDYQATLNPVLDLAAGGTSAITVSIAATPTEGDIIPLQATLSNVSGIDSGPVTAAFFAEAPGWGDWYIGSAFVTNIPHGGSVLINIDWNTTGFFGNVKVKVVVNPYGRLAETGASNNIGTTSFSISPAAKQDQSINFGALSARTLGIGPFTVNATASSDLAVSVTSSTLSVCTVSGKTVTLLKTGTCTLVASQAGDGQFNPASSVTQSFIVNAADSPKEAQSITFAKPADHVIGDPAFAVNPSATSGLVVTVTSSTPTICTVSGKTVTMVAVGTCTLVASQAGNDQFSPATSVNRSFTVSPKQAQSIDFAKPDDQTIGAAPIALVATATSGLAVTFASTTPAVCTVSGNMVTLVAVGTCTVAASQAGNSQFAAAPAANQSFAVSPKQAQSIEFAKPSAHTIGDDPFDLLASATSGLAVTFTSNTADICTVDGNTVTLASAGTCTIVTSQSGNGQFEAATSVTQSFLVRSPDDPKVAQSINFTSPGNHTVGNEPFALVATATSGLVVTFTSNTPSVCTVIGDSITLVSAGICEIVASQAGNNTYEAAAEVVVNFIVSAPENTSDALFLPHVTHP